MEDVNYEDMEQFLSVIYGYIDVNCSNVISLLELADRFDVQDIMKKCEQPLIDAEDITDKDKLIHAENYRLSNVQTTILNSMTVDKLRICVINRSNFGEDTLRKLFQTTLALLNKKDGSRSSDDTPPSPIVRHQQPVWRQRLRCCSKPHCIHRKDENINNTTLIVEDKKLYVSKHILANVSPVFHTMFFSRFKESTDDEFSIQGVKYDDMERLLKIIHNYIEVDSSNCISLLELAYRFKIYEVMQKCKQPLIDAQDISDKDKLIYAERYGLSIVQTAVLHNITDQQLQALGEDTSEFGKEALKRLFMTAFFVLQRSDWSSNLDRLRNE